MNTLEQIKHDYEQTHYRKQRELIDAGKLDYWGLSKQNRKGIVAQCKEEAVKYPELMWQPCSRREYPNGGDVRPSISWLFNTYLIYYRRLDPLPEEQDEVAELKKELKEKEEEIKLIEAHLEAQRIELENQVERNQNQMEQIKRLEQVAEYDNQDAERQANLIANYRKEEASLYRDIRTLAMHITNQ